MILGVLLFIVVLLVSLLDHLERWKKGEGVNHKRAWAIRSIALIPSIMFLSNWKIDITTIIAIFLEASTFWVLFDGYYNIKRNFNWWFLGSIDADESWFDNLQRKIPLKWLKVLKVGVPIVLLIVFIILKLNRT